MMTRIPIPVIASHDLRRGHGVVIRQGTHGELTGVTGAIPGHYTVTFWPSGSAGLPVIVDHLTRIDLKES